MADVHRRAGFDSPPVVVLARGGRELAAWPLPADGDPDLGLVDDLCRLQLDAGRLGCTIVVRNPCARLAGLLELVGLADQLLLPLEARRQAEGGEEGGVEEVVEPGDPTA